MDRTALNEAVILRQFSELTVSPVAVAALAGPPRAFPLFPEEEIAIKGAVPSRRLEFASGRHCARTALARLGGAPDSIGVDDNRAPVWPAGFVGSISHCTGLCCSVVARATDFLSIGMDVESSAPMPAGLSTLIHTDQEYTAIRAMPGRTDGAWRKILFSAKEAYFKAYFPIVRRFIDFLDVHVALFQEADDSGWFTASLLQADFTEGQAGLQCLKGRWVVSAGMVATAIVVHAPERVARRAQ